MLRPAVVFTVVLWSVASPSFSAMTAGGQSIYEEKCRECHGGRGEKAALGRSRPLAVLAEGDILGRLKDAQGRPAGPQMKDRMKNGLADADIHALAAYIRSLGGR